ncbi:Protein of unknown function [Bacillus cytotoxicus]|uniref:Uncharacterized protein n=1 Tax=Bacillus cytotoxicus TaxID=580165 RepID=A0AAX2CDT6_9BACI|nr:Protein of unknown function [Bacillus cytotoxicus]SCN32107.1 Protein of unknown function [Bacillus cytotoxicus]
MAVYRLMWRRN